MHYRGSLRWLDLLQPATSAYNNRPQRIGLGKLTPSEAKLPKNRAYLEKYFHDRKVGYESQFYKQIPKLKINDNVLIQKPRTSFSRGYTTNYDPKKIYKVIEIRRTYPVTYKLAPNDDSSHVLSNFFYEPELSKINNLQKSLHIVEIKNVPDTYLRSGRIKTYKQVYLIKDRNSGTSRWIDQTELKLLKKTDQLTE